ncbi:Putative ribonuclease H protein At1g65750 [Linum grandiflorum]
MASLRNRSTIKPPPPVDLIGWSSPEVGWVKLNVDGSVVSASPSAAIGVVLRDDQGFWIGGLCNWIGTQDILHAELRALRDGLTWVRMLGYRKVKVETDSLTSVQLLQSEDITGHPLKALVRDIMLIKAEGWCEITHIRREANFVADGLAKLGHGERNGERWFSSTPEMLRELVEADRRGRKYKRGGQVVAG